MQRTKIILAQPIAFSQMCSCGHQITRFVDLLNYVSELFLPEEIGSLNHESKFERLMKDMNCCTEISNTIAKFHVSVIRTCESVRIAPLAFYIFHFLSLISLNVSICTTIKG